MTGLSKACKLTGGTIGIIISVLLCLFVPFCIDAALRGRVGAVFCFSPEVCQYILLFCEIRRESF